MRGYEPEDERITFWTDEESPEKWHLDVRELLAEGGEPYSDIMECIQQLEAGDHLVIHALMEHRPLLTQLTQMGFTVTAIRVGPDHWQVNIGAP